MWKRLGRDGSRYWGSRGAGIFFTDGRKVLLLKRSEKGDGFGTWGLPGGKVEEGETDIDAAIREAEEECGRVAGQRFDDLREKDGMHEWTTFFFRVDKPFRCKLSDEHSDWKWVKFGSLKNYDLHPKLKENLDRHLKAVRKSSGKGVIKFREWLDFRCDSRRSI
jgi:8-oxo-dGTP diphosphatase